MSQVMGGRYRVVRELARGGMGRVLLADDMVLGRRVALKTLINLGQPELQLRFVEEAQITGQLMHPEVVSVHELARGDDGAPYMVMKLVAGRDLNQLIKALAAGERKARRDYPLDRLLRIFLKVCEAAAYAHDRGVVHRDLKPANLMVGQGDEVLVMDWGLAKPLGKADTHSVVSVARQAVEVSGSGDMTRYGAVVGTPAYMPPEQAEGHGDLDERADVYSLGAILYELLTYRAPYTGGPASILRRLLEGEAPPPPRVAAPSNEIPLALEAITQRAMAMQRAERYPDAAALAADVEAYLDKRAVAAHQETFAEALRRLATRHRVALLSAAATVGGLLIALLVAALVVATWRDEAQQAEAAALEAASASQGARQLADLTRQAASNATRALAAASELERDAQRVQRPDELTSLHLRLREEITALRGEPAADAADSLAGLHEDLDRALTRADRALAEAALGSWPALLLERRGDERRVDLLALGDERPLLATRALLCLGDREGALRELDRAPPPDDEALDRQRTALLAYLRDDRLSSQAELLSRALQVAPHATWLHVLRAEVRARLGEHQQAQAELEEAATRRPRDGWIPYVRLLHATSMLENHVHISHAADLVPLLAPHLEARARSVGALRRLWGRWSGDYESERDDGTRAGFRPQVEGRVESGDVPAWEGHLLLAEGGLRRERPDAAEEHARKVLAGGERQRDAEGILALALTRLGRPDEAQAVAEAGLLRFPDDGRLARARGLALVAQGELRTAAPFLEQGARCSSYPAPSHELARCLLEIGDAEALKAGVVAARRALSFDSLDSYSLRGDPQLAPGDPALHRTLAALRAAQGQSMLSAVHTHRALLLSTHSLYTRDHGVHLDDALTLGRLHAELGMPGVAAHYYQTAQQDPELASEAGRLLRELR